MKKFMFLAVIVLFSAAVTHAQTRIGARGGVNIAGVNGDDTDGTESRVGLNIGAAFNFEVSELFSVQPEVTYSMRGFKDGEFTIKIDYVDVPVMADFEIAEGLSLQGGPIFGFNISGNVEDGAGNETDLEDVSTLNIGAGIGAQYELPAGLFFNVRYDMGFNDVIDNNFDAKNCNIGFGVGYWFTGGGGPE
ncbi:MAG: PorT family protein [Bacteroidia bacterium]|nr:PorT family protein [Bacteroidia bacterium]NNM24143.1 PorT family protein [Flavobacteriaceae bacterium]